MTVRFRRTATTPQPFGTQPNRADDPTQLGTRAANANETGPSVGIESCSGGGEQIAIPGGGEPPTFTVQHERVCKVVAEMLWEARWRPSPDDTDLEESEKGPGKDEPICGSEPPRDGQWGDCWCTLPPDHDGECVCAPCRERHGAPGWRCAEPDDTNVTGPEFDRMMAEGTPVQIAAGPPDTHGAHRCGNCSGIDPDTCLLNPNRGGPVDLRTAVYRILNVETEFVGCPSATTDRIMAEVQARIQAGDQAFPVIAEEAQPVSDVRRQQYTDALVALLRAKGYDPEDPDVDHDQFDRETAEVVDAVMAVRDAELAQALAELAEARAQVAIDTQVMEKADRDIDGIIATGRYFRQQAEQTQTWGEQHRDRANRYRERLKTTEAARDRYQKAWEAAEEAWRDATARAEQAEALLRDLADPDPCVHDHHGGCQAHGYLSLQPGERCPHAEAKEHLAALTPPAPEETTDA